MKRQFLSILFLFCQGGRMPIIEEQKQKIMGEAVSYPTPAEVSYPATHTNSQHHAHQNKPKVLI